MVGRWPGNIQWGWYKGYFSKIWLQRLTSASTPHLHLWESLLFLLAQGRSHEQFMPHFQEDIGRAECLSLCLLFLSCLQLEITLVPKWLILQWHVLNLLRNKAKNNYAYFQSYMKHFPIRLIKNYLILQRLYYLQFYNALLIREQFLWKYVLT